MFDSQLISRFLAMRKLTESLCASLEVEDYTIQSRPWVSPPKWHLAHTSWFFERFILDSYDSYKPYHPKFYQLFNSYYKSQGQHWIQSERGQLARPTVKETYQYRAFVTESIEAFFQQEQNEKLMAFLEIGIQHEQQHQELLLMDVKHNFSLQPFNVNYKQGDYPQSSLSEKNWLEFEEGLYLQGHQTAGFAFDNETPQHQVFVPAFAIESNLITNADYVEFINDQGYQRAEFWHSLGWDKIQQEKWTAPLYWFEVEGQWFQYTLYGKKALVLEEPVSHLSFFEAAAFASWKGHRLPTEAEWEVAASSVAEVGTFLDSQAYAPLSQGKNFHGTLWEWTESAYLPYPGFRKQEGALGEYNSKFMCGQMVLKGGSFATPESHYRPTYRNFFFPEQRWMFSGVRLAKDLL